MSPTLTFDISPLLGQIKSASALMDRDVDDLIRGVATRSIYSSGRVPGVINITPPFSGDTKGKAGLAAGKASIDRDTGGIFSGVTLKHQRAITQVFGKPLATPIIVPTKELKPDVQGIYDQRNARRKGKRLTRGQKAAHYVDINKLNAVRDKLYQRIGWACAAWYQAAITAGLAPRGVPAWVRRHSAAPGVGSISVGKGAFTITLISSLDYNDALGMESKMARVMGYQENALRRQMPYLVRAALKRAGMRAT